MNYAEKYFDWGVGGQVRRCLTLFLLVVGTSQVQGGHLWDQGSSEPWYVAHRTAPSFQPSATQTVWPSVAEEPVTIASTGRIEWLEQLIDAPSTAGASETIRQLPREMVNLDLAGASFAGPASTPELFAVTTNTSAAWQAWDELPSERLPQAESAAWLVDAAPARNVSAETLADIQWLPVPLVGLMFGLAWLSRSYLLRQVGGASDARHLAPH